MYEDTGNIGSHLVRERLCTRAIVFSNFSPSGRKSAMDSKLMLNISTELGGIEPDTSTPYQNLEVMIRRPVPPCSYDMYVLSEPSYFTSSRCPGWKYFIPALKPVIVELLR